MQPDAKHLAVTSEEISKFKYIDHKVHHTEAMDTLVITVPSVKETTRSLYCWH